MNSILVSSDHCRTVSKYNAIRNSNISIFTRLSTQKILSILKEGRVPIIMPKEAIIMAIFVTCVNLVFLKNGFVILLETDSGSYFKARYPL